MSKQTVGACDSVYSDVPSPPFMPNPDVSGIGVLIGFLATAYLTFLFVVIYYLTGCVEETFINEIDKMVLAKCSLRKHVKSVRRLELTLGRAVLIFSDQQVVTGIGLLSSGYAQLKSGIDIYHWQILVYLAWFSSVTHLTTLTVLRQYFRDNVAARLWRSVLMLVTVTMLGVALVPTGDYLWFTAGYGGYSLGVPALCFFQRLVSRDPNQRYTIGAISTSSMIVSLFVLISGYLMRLIKLSEKATAFNRRWIRTKPSRKIGSLRDNALKRVARPIPKILNSHWVSAYVFLEALHIFLRALLDIYESMLWEILWLAFALAWGTRNLFITRAYNSDNTENTWGFGQLFPVLLLVLPLLSILETYYEDEISPRPDSEGAASGGDVHVKYSVQPRLLRVGQWGPRSTSTTYTSVIALEDHPTLRRTGTVIKTEEQQLDSTSPVISLHSTLRLENHDTLLPSPGGESTGRGNRSDLDIECYDFEWFWILVLMLVGSLFGVVSFALAVSGKIVDLWQKLLTVLAISLTLCFCYTVAFVVLSLFHEALGKMLKTRLKFKLQKQRNVLRILAWLCLPCCLGLVSSLFLFNTG